MKTASLVYSAVGRDKHAPKEGTATMVREVHARPLGAVLRVLDARAKPAVFKLGTGRCVVGAGADADVVIDDTTVSRTHARISAGGNGGTSASSMSADLPKGGRV